MTEPTAIIIADSISQVGKRITTFQITAHRFILAEINTHRVLSRNYRSSRAVPTAKLIQEVRENPATPVYWGKNQPGMQAAEELDYDDIIGSMLVWHSAAEKAAWHAEKLLCKGVHKQIVNRVLEPYLMAHGVITATEWANFYALRRHPDAQPEFRALANAMWKAQQESKPVCLRSGDWHLPYVTKEDSGDLACLKAVSAARCARVSYKPFDADRPSTIAEDLDLCNKLLNGDQIHASPFEHQATPDRLVWNNGLPTTTWHHPHMHGNFVGWVQHRKQIHREAVDG